MTKLTERNLELYEAREEGRQEERERCKEIVVEENYKLEEYLAHLEGKVTGFEIAQHTMATRNHITNRLTALTPTK